MASPYGMARGGSQLWSWLDELPFALRTPKDKPGWAGLLQICVRPIFLDTAGRRRMVHGLLFPLGPSEWVAHMSGLTCMETGLAVVPRGGLITCVLAVCY